MPYSYQEEREKLFTDEGQKLLLEIRDRTFRLIDMAGAVSVDKAIAGSSGEAWKMLACLDRLVEIGDIYEVERKHPVRGQYRIFSRHQ